MSYILFATIRTSSLHNNLTTEFKIKINVKTIWLNMKSYEY